MKRANEFIALGCLAVALALPSTAAAAPRTTRDCTGETDVYARLMCRQQGILDAQDALVTKFEERFGGSPENRSNIQKMKNVHVRSKAAAGRNDAAKFKNAAKKQRRGGEETCALRLMDGAVDDGNGVCDPGLGERCAQASDFTKECNPTKQHGKNDDCARTCTDDVTESAAEDAADAVVAAELLQAYDDTESTLVETHNKVDEAGSSTGIRLAAPAVACPPGAPDSSFVDFFKRAEAVLEGIDMLAAPLCAQVFVAVVLGNGGGGNGMMACTIIAGAHAVAKFALSNEEVKYQAAQTQWQVDSVSCLAQRLDAVILTQAAQSGDLAALADAIQGVKSDVAASEHAVRLDMAAKHDALTSTMASHGREMRGHFLDLVLLLTTPQGQRTGFPAK